MIVAPLEILLLLGGFILIERSIVAMLLAQIDAIGVIFLVVVW